jgi:hypothetical protein
MADTKISALTADTAPDRVADYVPTYDASAVATKKVLLSLLGGYYIHMQGATLSPADATSYYFGSILGWGASAANQKFYIPRAGKLVKARIFIVGTNGSAETSTISFRLNDTTDTTITSTAVCNALPYTTVNSALSVAVAEDDYFCVKWVTPTWVTNPANCSFACMLWFT